jgi:DNA-binding transcriptional regulator YiaG
MTTATMPPPSSNAERRFSGSRLRAMREERGLSIAELAVRLKVGVSTLRSWENGQHAPMRHHEAALMRRFGCARADLYE